MEQRLAQLKATMSAEREKRSAAQQANPSGSVWRSGRTDVPVRGGKYVDQVLAAKPPPKPKRADDGADMSRTGNRFGLVPLVQPAGEGMDGAATAAGSGMAALRSSAGSSTFGQEDWQSGRSTRKEWADGTQEVAQPGSWNPLAAVADNGHDYEELLGPPTEEEHALSQGGGALWGTFDEEANRSSFASAVAEWRGEPPPPLPLTTRLATKTPDGTGAGAGTGTGTGGGGALWGTFDEQANEEAFQAAVAQWRGEPVARAEQQPRSSPLTLAQKVRAISTELRLPEQQPLAEAVAQANAIVGIAAQGPLLEQVGRLLHELGLEPQPQPAPPRSPAPSSMGVQAGSSAGKNYFELLQEQKRKDGLL